MRRSLTHILCLNSFLSMELMHPRKASISASSLCISKVAFLHVSLSSNLVFFSLCISQWKSFCEARALRSALEI